MCNRYERSRKVSLRVWGDLVGGFQLHIRRKRRPPKGRGASNTSRRTYSYTRGGEDVSYFFYTFFVANARFIDCTSVSANARSSGSSNGRDGRRDYKTSNA